MRCEEIQKELAQDSIDPAMRAAVSNHVASCAACRGVQMLYARMDESLKRNLVWAPSARFANRVVCQIGPLEGGVSSPPLILFRDVVYGVLVALLAAVITYLGAGLFIQAMASNLRVMTWSCVAISMLLSAWFTRRAFR